MAEASDKPPGRDLNRMWLGLPAGVAGVLLLIAVELAASRAGPGPSVRYPPPPRSDGAAIAISPQVTYIVSPTVQGLQAAFVHAGYSLNSVRANRAPVPRLRLAVLPRDLPDMKDAGERKAVFLSLALPLVLEANARVAMDRRRLLHAIDKLAAGKPVSQKVEDWLERLAKRYRTSPNHLDELLRRVDGVPPSLFLAQAATESGWGTSRFAIDGNAIFGQWTTARGRGIVPEERPEGETYKIRSFDRLIDSFDAYLQNLNYHRAYRNFRKTRARMREEKIPLDGTELAGDLLSYSEIGEEYVTLIHGIIRKNRLTPLDGAALGDNLIAFAPGV